jgi:hypothetical protein
MSLLVQWGSFANIMRFAKLQSFHFPSRPTPNQRGFYCHLPHHSTNSRGNSNTVRGDWIGDGLGTPLFDGSLTYTVVLKRAVFDYISQFTVLTGSDHAPATAFPVDLLDPNLHIQDFSLQTWKRQHVSPKLRQHCPRMHIPKSKIKNIPFDSFADGLCSLCRTNLFPLLGPQVQRTPTSNTATTNSNLTNLTSHRQLLGRLRVKAVTLHYNGGKWERHEKMASPSEQQTFPFPEWPS